MEEEEEGSGWSGSCTLGSDRERVLWMESRGLLSDFPIIPPFPEGSCWFVRSPGLSSPSDCVRSRGGAGGGGKGEDSGCSLSRTIPFVLRKEGELAR